MSAVASNGGTALVLGLADAKSPEVALLLHELPREIAPGEQIEFSAVPIGFIRDPFLVTFDTGKATIVLKPFGVLAPSWYFGDPMGAIRSGRYHCAGTRVEFDLPSDWTIEATRPSIEAGEVVILKYPPLEGALAGVWMGHYKIGSADGVKVISAIPDTLVGAGLQGYQLRPESIQEVWIAGRQALKTIGDYEENGRKMSESLIWIVTEHTRALFFAQAAAYDLPIFQTHFDQIISSAVVP